MAPAQNNSLILQTIKKQTTMKKIKLTMIAVQWYLIMLATIATLVFAEYKASGQDAGSMYLADQTKTVIVENTAPGVIIEGQYLDETNPMKQFFAENIWVLYSIIGFMFFMMIRVGYINFIVWNWNNKIDQYIEYGVYENCLSEGQEFSVRNSKLESDYRLWFKLNKWHVSDFVRDRKIYNNVEYVYRNF